MKPLKSRRWRRVIGELVMVSIALLFAAPFYILVVVSLKPSSEVFTTSPMVPSLRPDFGNFVTVFTADAGGAGLGAASDRFFSPITWNWDLKVPGNKELVDAYHAAYPKEPYPPASEMPDAIQHDWPRYGRVSQS